MITKEALLHLENNSQIPFVIAAAKEATPENPSILVPDGYKHLDLESHMPFRKEYRGNFNTDSLPDFISYIKEFEKEGSKCFINSERMSANAVLDLGTPEFPLHSRHSTKLVLNKTAPFAAMLEIDGSRLTQKELSEWIEDWSDIISATGTDGNHMTAKAAASSIRSITIDVARKLEVEVGSFNENMSASERIEASSKGVLPAELLFTCKPYRDLSARSFLLKVGILTGGDKPVLVARIVQLESVKEEIVEEFKQLITFNLDDDECNTKAFIGSFGS